jgi:hypothetical protein
MEHFGGTKIIKIILSNVLGKTIHMHTDNYTVRNELYKSSELN